MKTLTTLVAAMALSGCAGMGMNSVQGLTAEQIAAASKDKASGVACSTYVGTGGSFNVLYLNADQTYHTGGGEMVVKCGGSEVTFKDAGKAPTPPKAP